MHVCRGIINISSGRCRRVAGVIMWLEIAESEANVSPHLTPLSSSLLLACLASDPSLSTLAAL